MNDPAAGAGPPSRGDRRGRSRELSPDQQFWQLWRAGGRPDPRDFLAARPGLAAPEVAAVLTIDQYERWLTGERVPAEDYIARLPPGPDLNQAACDLIYGEYLLREQLGERPDAAGYAARFPVQAALLTRQLEVHHALADSPPPSRSRHVRTPAPATLPVPASEAIPGYEVLGELGRGGMGVVYKARQLNLDRVVALKVLPLSADPAASGLDRMRREARVMARLSHPHIVTVFDAGSTSSSFFLAMEYIAGSDLHRLVEQHGPLPTVAACDYIRQAALGLQHAHDHGLVHRDIKPSNLIVAGDRPLESGTLKILDLGLVRLVTATPAAQGEITHVGTFMGTPDFIAPEQANDPRSADQRSDLYSLGCTFFFLLTGQPPFAGATPLAKLMHHHLTDSPDVRQLRPDVPSGVAEVLRRLLAKRPEDRYQTAAEVAAALAAPVGALVPAPPAPARTGLLHRLSGHGDWVKGVAFSPDGAWLVTGSLDRTVRLWERSTGEAAWRSEELCGGVLCVGVAPDGATMLCGGEEGLIACWELPARRQRWQTRCQSSNVNCLAFGRATGRALTGGHDGALRLWDTERGQPIRQWSAHTGTIWGVALSGDGRIALSGGQDRMLRLWDVASGESLLALPEQPMLVTCVALSADGRIVLSGGVDGVIHVWDPGARREVRLLEGHEARITSLAFSPDGQQVVSGSRDHSVRLWQVVTGRQLHRFDEHSRWVNAVAWCADGRHIASGGTDKVACIYTVEA